MKPVILAAGSCIVENLMIGVRDLSVGSEYFEFVMSLGAATGGRLPLSASVLSRCRLLIEEASPWVRMLSEDERSQLPGDCKQILVPTIHFNSLWPLMAIDPRNAAEPNFPFGRIPFDRGDRLALDIMRRETDPAKRVATYFGTDLSSVVDIGRHHALELENMFALERNCDVRMAAYIATNFRETRLFHTHHHPGPEVMTFALMQLLAHPAILECTSKPLATALAGLPAWAEVVRANFEIETAPIHPTVAEFFDLAWYRDDMTFRSRDREFTFKEWIEFYFAYEPAAGPRKT